MHTFRLLAILLILFSSATCGRGPSPAPLPPASTAVPATPAVAPPPQASATPPTGPLYLNPSAPTAQRVADLLSRMTLAEKIGQMTQVEKNSIQPGDVTGYFIGSVLSGGGGSPLENTPEAWAAMVDGYQKGALATRLRIPLIYGVDAVHGHNNLYGAVIFPHNIGLGAADDPALVEKIGAATAEEMSATGIRWNFAPVVAVVQDIRWGRTYEGYSENTGLVSRLGAAYIRGLQNASGKGLATPPSVLATAKHYIGDGGTTWGSAASPYRLDTGDLQVDEATLRKVFLPPYEEAIKAGAQSIMVSFSSWNGVKMHAQKHLLTGVLKGELGFQGFLVSDWQAIDAIPGSYDSDVVTAINAGLDMVMVPSAYPDFITSLTSAVYSGAVPQERIDDAVRRILTAKFNLGLFEHPYAERALLPTVGSDAHRALAREAVAKSLVLLKNDNQALPVPKDAPLIYVGGRLADDIGAQCGGWTIEWQGKSGSITPGTTVLEAVRGAVSAKTKVEYSVDGSFSAAGGKAGLGIAVVGEAPYAEGVGDRDNLALSTADRELIQSMRQRSKKLVVVLISGRPLLITEELASADAWVAAWLPGTEGAGITDVLFGDRPFTGKLPYTWPAAMDQLPLGPVHPGSAGQKPLFPYGFGLQ